MSTVDNQSSVLMRTPRNSSADRYTNRAMPPVALQASSCPLTPDSTAEIGRRLRAALDGGPALLPLPPDDSAADRLGAALHPERGAPAGTAVVIATSGSTGTPKGVCLSATALV